MYWRVLWKHICLPIPVSICLQLYREYCVIIKLMGLSSTECFYSRANHPFSWRSQRSETVCGLFVGLFVLRVAPSYKAHNPSLLSQQSSILATTPKASNIFIKVKDQCLATHLKDTADLPNSVVLCQGHFALLLPGTYNNVWRYFLVFRTRVGVLPSSST